MPPQISATTIGFDVTGRNTSNGIDSAPWSTGFAFSVTSPVTVDSLLLYDFGSDGYQGGGGSNIVVSIFDDDGTTTVVSGLTATFDSATATAFGGNSPINCRWLEIDVTNATLGLGDYNRRTGHP